MSENIVGTKGAGVRIGRNPGNVTGEVVELVSTGKYARLRLKVDGQDKPVTVSRKSFQPLEASA